MWKLLLFEGRKMARSLFVLLATILLLGVCAIDIWRPWDTFETDFANDTVKALNRGADIYISLTPEERTRLNEHVAELRSMSLSEDEYTALPGLFGKTATDDINISIASIAEVMYEQEIKSRRETALETAQRLLSKAERTGDSYEARRNQTLVSAYSEPLPVNYYRNNGYEELLRKNYLSYLPYLLVILLTAGSFSSERQSGSWMWLNASRRGRGTVAAAKYAAAGCLAFLTSLLFSLTAIIATGIKFSLPGLNMPLASALRGAEMVPYQISVLQFLLLYSLIPALGAVFLSAICCLISQYNRNSFLSMGLCVVFVGLSYGYGIVTGLQSYTAEPLKLPNILNWLDPLSYLYKYNTANVFGFPISWIWVHAAFWTLLTIGIIAWGIKKDLKVRMSI